MAESARAVPGKYFTAEELVELAQSPAAATLLLSAALLQIEQLQARAKQLKEARALEPRVRELEQALEEAQRARCRQAAPFRLAEQKRASAPKPPGRPAGHAGSCRPMPKCIDEEIVVELSRCACGSSQWVDQHGIEQLIEELPEVRPRVTRLVTYEATCAECGQKASSQHPLKVSHATGAAAVHLGPRALAIATDLNKAKGLPMRKTCALLRDLFGLALSPGGLAQAMTRVSHKVQADYEALGQQLRQAPALHVDETSWWVGASGWWLWVFTCAQGTYYRIEQSRARTVLEAVIGADFAGVLISDCLSVYDLETVGPQQKCLAHHAKAVRDAKEAHPEKGKGYLEEVGEALRSILDLREKKATCTTDDFLQKRRQTQAKMDALLESERRERHEESVRRRLCKQRDHLFTFLEHEGVDATNNLAERQLRPAVIARKISCGNKTVQGANTFAILSSLAATHQQTGGNFRQFIDRAVRLDSG